MSLDPNDNIGLTSSLPPLPPLLLSLAGTAPLPFLRIGVDSRYRSSVQVQKPVQIGIDGLVVLPQPTGLQKPPGREVEEG